MSKQFFIEMLDGFLGEFPVREVVFAFPGLVDFGPCYGKNLYSFNLTLSGCRHLKYSSEGEMKDAFLTPDKAMFRVPGGWAKSLFESEFKCLIFIVFPNSISVQLNINDEQTPGPHLPNMSYSMTGALNPVARNFLDALEAAPGQRFDQSISTTALKGFLQVMLQELTRSNVAEAKYSKSILCQAICDYLNKNFAENIGRDDVAEKMQISPQYLSRIFKEQTGTGFNEYLSLLRVYYAKRLLVTTRYTVDDIALKSGFAGANYFIKVFRKHFNTTPEKFRR